MHTLAFDNRSLGKVVTVRPLANGDIATVESLLDRLSPASRELADLARVGPDSHVLVAYVDGDPLPAGMARLVRDASNRTAGELAFEVADCYQGAGLGKLLIELLLADARAAGFRRVDAWVQTSNRSTLGLLRRVLGRTTVRVEGAETLVVATLA